jgi:hypothetical protein
VSPPQADRSGFQPLSEATAFQAVEYSRNALPESRRAVVANLASSRGWRRLDERIQAVSAKIESLS